MNCKVAFNANYATKCFPLFTAIKVHNLQRIVIEKIRS